MTGSSCPSRRRGGGGGGGGGSSDLWQVTDDGAAFSPACRASDVDCVVALLDRLDRGIATAASSARLARPNPHSRSARRSRRDAQADGAAAAVDATPPPARRHQSAAATARLATPAKSPAQQHPLAVARQRARAAAAAAAAAEAGLSTPQQESQEAAPPPPPPSDDATRKLPKATEDAMLKRLHTEAVQRRRTRAAELAQRREAGEVRGVRQAYMKMDDAAINEKLHAWAARAGERLAARTAAEVQGRPASAPDRRGGADTLERDRVLGKLSGLPGVAEAAAEALAPAAAAGVAPRGPAWVGGTLARAKVKAAGAEDRRLVAACEAPATVTLPADQLPHEAWARRGAAALSKKVAAEKAEAAPTSDNVERFNVLAKLVKHGLAEDGDGDLALVPATHPQKGHAPWVACSHAGDITKQQAAEEKRLHARTDPAPVAKVPADEMSHEAWARQGAVAISREVVREKRSQAEDAARLGDAPYSQENVEKHKVMSKIVSQAAGGGGGGGGGDDEGTWHPFPCEHPMKGATLWVQHTGPRHAHKREIERDREVVSCSPPAR